MLLDSVCTPYVHCTQLILESLPELDKFLRLLLATRVVCYLPVYTCHCHFAFSSGYSESDISERCIAVRITSVWYEYLNLSHIAVTSKLGQNLHKMPWTMPVQLEVVEIRAAGQFNFKVDM